MRHPNLFIVGGPRCGTTSLYFYLKQHPQVFMSPVKEPHHFSTDIDSGTPEAALFFTRDLATYLKLFKGAGNEKWVGEASTTYLYSPSAAERIRSFSPDARIIVALRDPIEVIHSLHTLRVADGGEDIEDFEEALAAEEDRRWGKRLPPGSFHRGAYLYRDRARFGAQLARFLDVFPRPQVHVLLLEDMVDSPVATYRKLLTFLEIDAERTPSEFRTWNPARRVQSGRLRGILRSPRGHAIVRRTFPPAMQNVARLLSRRVRRLNESPVQRPPLRSELRRALQLQFADDVALASRLVGRDLVDAWWSTDDYDAPAN